MKRQKCLILPCMLARNEAQFERRLGTKDVRNPKQKFGRAEPSANIMFRQKTKKTSSPHFKFKLRRRAPQIKLKTTPAHGKRKHCSIIKWNTVFINRYECNPGFEHNNARNLVVWEKLTPASLGICGRHRNKRFECFCGRSQPSSLKGGSIAVLSVSQCNFFSVLDSGAADRDMRLSQPNAKLDCHVRVWCDVAAISRALPIDDALRRDWPVLHEWPGCLHTLFEINEWRG